MNRFAIHLKLTQHCKSTIPQYKIKTFKNVSIKKWGEKSLCGSRSLCKYGAICWLWPLWATSEVISLKITVSAWHSFPTCKHNVYHGAKGGFIQREENSPSSILCNNSQSCFVLRVPLTGWGKRLVQTGASGTFSPNMEETLHQVSPWVRQALALSSAGFLCGLSVHTQLLWPLGQLLLLLDAFLGLAFYEKSWEFFLSGAAVWRLYQSAKSPPISLPNIYQRLFSLRDADKTGPPFNSILSASCNSSVFSAFHPGESRPLGFPGKEAVPSSGVCLCHWPRSEGTQIHPSPAQLPLWPSVAYLQKILLDFPETIRVPQFSSKLLSCCAIKVGNTKLPEMLWLSAPWKWYSKYPFRYVCLRGVHPTLPSTTVERGQNSQATRAPANCSYKVYTLQPYKIYFRISRRQECERINHCNLLKLHLPFDNFRLSLWWVSHELR